MTAQQQLQPARRDMPSRYAGMLDDGMSIQDANPERAYTLVYKDAETVSKYEYMGYEAEVYREGGPRLGIQKRLSKNDKRAGQHVECSGHLLMSIPRSELADLRKHGGRGAGMGTAPWDQIEKRLRSKSGSVDALEGVHLAGVKVSALSEDE